MSQTSRGGGGGSGGGARRPWSMVALHPPPVHTLATAAVPLRPNATGASTSKTVTPASRPSPSTSTLPPALSIRPSFRAGAGAGSSSSSSDPLSPTLSSVDLHSKSAVVPIGSGGAGDGQPGTAAVGAGGGRRTVVAPVDDGADDARSRSIHTRRKRSFVSSRVWLFVVNLLVLLVAAATLFIGGAMQRFADTDLKKTNSTTSQPTSASSSSSFNISVATIAMSTLIYGFCMALSGIFGAGALILRNPALLSLYIAALVLVLLLTAGGGGYALFLLDARVHAWSSVTRAAWVASSDSDKALAQWVFSCCGFASAADAPYVGAPLYAAQGTSNPCAAKNATGTGGGGGGGGVGGGGGSMPGCSDAGFEFWSGLIKTSGVVLGIALIFVIISIGAAAQLKRKEDARVKYYRIEDSRPG
ncbi:hypothetical protein HK405_000311 [Cladochytrium tenue]|nr:hypothetical protein HK405_000311 [Cladochytrium tenue]